MINRASRFWLSSAWGLRLLFTVLLLLLGLSAPHKPAVAQANGGEGTAAVGTTAESTGEAGALGEADSPRRSRVSAILASMRSRFEREERPLGSRSWLCPYAPGLLGESDQIWSDRPMFLWQSAATTIAVLSYDRNEALWSAPLTDGQTSIEYGGERPLEPGQIYRWQLSHPERSTFEATFSIMSPTERLGIQTQLDQLELEWSDAGTDEQAIARADFFSEKSLWSDALQELQLAQGNDEEIQQFSASLAAYICNLPDPATETVLVSED